MASGRGLPHDRKFNLNMVSAMAPPASSAVVHKLKLLTEEHIVSLQLWLS